MVVRRATIVFSVQKFVPVKLHRAALNNAYSSVSAEHPGSGQIHDTMRRHSTNHTWPATCVDWWSHAWGCPWNLQAYKQQRELPVFPASVPMKLVAIDISGSLTKTLKVTRIVVLITDLYFKLTRAIPMKTNTAPQTAIVLMDSRVVLCGIPEFVLTNWNPAVFQQVL